MSTNPLALSADEIFKIPESNPERLFTQTDLKKQWQRFSRKWHPDRSNFDPSGKVLAHIQNIYKEAQKHLDSGTWKGAAEIRFTSGKGKTFRFAYRTMHEIELGKMYVAKGLLMFVVDKDYEDLFNNGIKRIRSIKYPPKLKDEFVRYFPKIKFVDKTTDIGLVAILEKPQGTVLLQDLIDYMPDNRIDPKHVAWITSSLYNIATFLDHTGVCHNSIIPTAVFIDPANHASILLGGWWYATKNGEKLKAVPSTLLKTLPNEVFDTKISNTKYDRKAVKGVAIACLGDPTMVGANLLIRKDVPKELTSWVRAPSGPDAIKEYDGWYKALENSFGKRKFIKLNVDVDDIY